MPWIKLPGIEGLVYEPEPSRNKKHPCPDCFSCQWCSDVRCSECLKRKKCRKQSVARKKKKK